MIDFENQNFGEVLAAGRPGFKASTVELRQPNLS